MSGLIAQQETDISLLDKKLIKEKKKIEKKKKDTKIKEKLARILEIVDEKKARLLYAAAEKGASSWLTALPIQSLGYSLNHS